MTPQRPGQQEQPLGREQVRIQLQVQVQVQVRVRVRVRVPVQEQARAPELGRAQVQRRLSYQNPRRCNHKQETAVLQELVLPAG